ncbi:enoyl-CoA hydratase/isomerase family protein [Cumulibacter soli]|uniref:enoyl-CoA hydratase/isomerase family protein n=1 Tax=Cumulibacter soli TaxID=2546344 RepID=UPI0010684B0B|nr:enoyl-CoA hydratase/isomerase family protein [Cumulibacter soli]
MTATLELDRPKPGVAVITFANPPRNQMSADALVAFHDILDELEKDLQVRCLVITGTGSSWCAGADLREERGQTPEQLKAHADSRASFGTLIGRLETIRFPVIAAINGYTIGGGMELALACDIRVGCEDAVFVCAGVNVGLIASWYRLPRAIGLGPAKHMLLTGDKFDADWALRNGLITALYGASSLLDESVKLADRIATRAPLSVEATKECSAQAFELSSESAAALHTEKFLIMAASADHREAVASFFEKRPATFLRK